MNDNELLFLEAHACTQLANRPDNTGARDTLKLIAALREARASVEIGEGGKVALFKFYKECDAYACPSCGSDLILRHHLITHFRFSYCPNCGVKLLWRD